MNKIEAIKKLAEELAASDESSDRKSVASHNRRVDRIRKLIAGVETDREYEELLRIQGTQRWMAFQLLEKHDELAAGLRMLACDVIRGVARQGGPAGFGARVRLQKIGEDVD